MQQKSSKERERERKFEKTPTAKLINMVDITQHVAKSTVQLSVAVTTRPTIHHHHNQLQTSTFPRVINTLRQPQLQKPTIKFQTKLQNTNDSISNQTPFLNSDQIGRPRRIAIAIVCNTHIQQKIKTHGGHLIW